MTEQTPKTGPEEMWEPGFLPVRMGNPSLAKQLKGGEDIAEWVAELRRTYPQDSDLKVLETY